MHVSLDQLGLALDTPLAVPTSRAYRPPSWPPPRDWVCIEDSEGNAVSRWGDPVWYLWPWTGKNDTFNFGDGPKLNSRSPVIDPANADVLREVVGWRLWGPYGGGSPTILVSGILTSVRQIIALCSQHKVLASDLSRYPALIEEVARSMAPGNFATVVAELDRLRDARDFLGFELLDQAGILRLTAAQPDHNKEQTEYIPPRIWTYLVMRLKECLDDYLAHEQQIEECFAFCVAAYEENGVKENRIGRVQSKRTPFQNSPRNRSGVRSGITYLGPFTNTAQRFGIKDNLERWGGELAARGRGIAGLSSYLSLIQYAALTDVLSFTLMRVAEGTSIRKNALVWHDDAVYGRIPLIQAETTKTDSDESALWVTSPSVESAIRVMQSVAKMRLSCIGEWTDAGNPYLINHSVEPWSKPKKAEQRLRPSVPSLASVVTLFPKLLDPQQLTITEDDFKIALAVSPALNRDVFQVGKPWHLAWHQLRRTGAVNMFASGDISDSSMQLQMKHLTRLMPLYYGRGNTSLHLNENTRVLLVNEQYEAMGRQLAAVQTDRFVSPYGEDHKKKLLAPGSEDPVNLVSEADARIYEKAARQHHVSFRRTVLGGCMKNGPCDGDCVSSVGDCAGGDGRSPCSNVLFDRNRAEANQIRLDGVVQQLETTPPDTPQYRHLEQEQRGLENYFAYINRT